MESIYESQPVWQSIDNIIGMERSLKAFWVALQEELDVIGGDHLAFVEGEQHSSRSDTDYYWVYTSECRSYRLKASDGGNDEALKGVLSIRIELWRKAEEHAESLWPHAKTPLIYVAFHCPSDPDSAEVEYYGVEDGNFGLDQHGEPYDESEEGNPYRARTPLWIWDEIPEDVDEWIESSWFFAVPLVAIRSYHDLQEQITEPLRALLIENRAREDVFRNSHAIPARALNIR